MTRILVTGATGFIGRHALPPLLAAGHEVHVIGRTAPDPLTGPGRILHHHADLLGPDLPAIVGSIAAEACLHLAWDVSPGFWTTPANLDWTAATLTLLRAFHQAGGRRFVGAGTCAEYDWTTPADTLREDAPRAPATLYGTAKDATRRLIEAYARSHGLSWAWGVLFFSFGPGERPERLVPSLTDALLAGREAPATAGTQIRDLLDSRDQGTAFAALLTSGVDGVVNIASGQPVALHEVMTLIGTLTGRPDLLRIGALPQRPGEPPRLVADTTRLRHDVGFTPAHTLRQGLTDLIAGRRG